MTESEGGLSGLISLKHMYSELTVDQLEQRHPAAWALLRQVVAASPSHSTRCHLATLPRLLAPSFFVARARASVAAADPSRARRRVNPSSHRFTAQWDRVFFNIMQPAADGREHQRHTGPRNACRCATPPLPPAAPL